MPAAKLQPYSLGPSQQPKMQMPALESGTERRRHSYVSPEAPKPQVATFTPAFQVRRGGTIQAVPSDPDSSMFVGRDTDLFFQRTDNYSCAAVCPAGVSQTPG